LSDLRLEIDHLALEPGTELRGDAVWDLDKGGRRVSLRLFWFTQGKGTEDLTVVERVELASGRARDRVRFCLAIPILGPYSFSGQLVSVRWALELVADDESLVVKKDIVVGPNRREVRIDREPA